VKFNLLSTAISKDKENVHDGKEKHTTGKTRRTIQIAGSTRLHRLHVYRVKKRNMLKRISGNIKLKFEKQKNIAMRKHAQYYSKNHVQFHQPEA
jgi:hypothetical protein